MTAQRRKIVTDMPEDVPKPSATESPDVQKIRHLVRLMHRYDLTAIDLGEGESKIRLRRRVGGDSSTPAYYAPLPAAPPPMPTVANSAPPTAHAQPIVPAPDGPKGVFIESPMVGTFYSASTPDAAPFAQAGTTVRADTTVCIIEAMKVFTDIPAGLSGTITEVLVKNGQPVEYGQPLFRIEPA